MSRRFAPRKLLQFANQKSPYYRELYQKCDLAKISWEDLPIVDLPSFWHANSYYNNHLLTEQIAQGVVFKSGGTTGAPKFSIYTNREWEEFTAIFGHHLAKNSLQRGDRVANLFYAGHLYASFLFIQKSFEKCPTPIVNFPISGNLPPEEIVSLLVQYQINTLAVVPSTLVNMVEQLRKHQRELHLNKILFGGEELYDDQRQLIQSLFPKIEICSIGYASVDGGHLGYVDVDCSSREHRVFTDSTIMEIVDPESGQQITEEGKVGRLIYTNLTRSLMPIIRYPVGDMAKWVESRVVDGKFFGEKFRLEGRSEDGARVGPVTINREDVAAIIKELAYSAMIVDFQMTITRQTTRDQLRLVLAIEGINLDNAKQIGADIIQHFYQQREMFKIAVEDGTIMPLKVKIVIPCDLERNPRTGKLLRVIDHRLEQ